MDENRKQVLPHGMPIKPKINFEQAKTIVRDLYGLIVTDITELNGYDDTNFHVSVEINSVENENIDEVCGCGYVLKIINTLDSLDDDFFEGQNALLLHLGRNKIGCPKPVLTKNKLYFSKISLQSGLHIVRLLEYIDGNILYKVPCSNSLFYETGKYVAQLDKALKHFRHPALESRKTIWNLEEVPQLQEFLFAVSDDNKKQLVKDIIKDFVDRVLSVSDKLQKGIIHGDFNEQNVIVAKDDNGWKIKAVIDFGDSHSACYLYELAITMTYMILQSRDIDVGGYVLAGYTSVWNLSDVEYFLLQVCIAARICQSLVIGAYTNLQDPSNTYVLTTASQGWLILKKIWEEPEDVLLQRWKTISERCRNAT